MAELIGTDLGLGHLGRAVYNPRTKSWEFGRNPGRHIVYRLLKGSYEFFASDFPDVDYSQIRHKEDDNFGSKWFDRDIGALVNAYPDIQPARHLLSSLEQISEAVLEATATYDPLLGGLVGYGFAQCAVANDNSPNPAVVALPDARDPGCLKIVRLEDVIFRWADSHDAGVIVGLPHEDVCWWAGPGAPIQQVCFSLDHTALKPDISSQASMLAVRCLDATYIFQPKCHRSPVASYSGRRNGQMISSTIESNPLLAITRDVTHGLQHAHVAYNPFNTQQLAVVDHAGNCAVVSIGYDESTSGWCIARPAERYLRPLAESEEREQYKHDGWARVLWVANTSTLTVAIRSQLRVFELTGRELSVPNLDLNGNSKWILDICRCHAQPDLLLVLTNSYLFWLRVVPTETEATDQKVKPGVYVLCNTRHFRDPMDITLQLAIYQRNRDTVVLLYSTLNAIITVFSFSTPEGFSEFPPMTSDPSELSIPLKVGATSDARKINAIVLRATRRPLQQANDDKGDEESHPTVLSLQVLASDLSLHQYFLWRGSNGMQPTQLLQEEPQMCKENRDPAAYGEQRVDEFVVPDHDYTDNHDASVISAGVPVVEKGRRKAKLWPVSKNENRVTKSVYHAILQETNALRPASGERSLDLVSILERLRISIEDSKEDTEENHPKLAQLATAILKVDDINEASELLDSLLNTVVPGDAVDDPTILMKTDALRWLLNHIGYRGVDVGNGTLSDLYRAIVQTFITPLPSKTPGRYRLALERQSRLLAARVCLAGSKVSAESARTEAEPQPDLPVTSPITFQLPVHPSSKGKEPLSSSSIGAFPTHGSSLYGSQEPWSSQSAPSIAGTSSKSSISLATTTLKTHLDTIKLYTTFSQPPAISSLRSAPRPLSHWTPGQDPSRYSWTATTAALSALEDASAFEALSEKERCRAQRKASRHLQRQREEARKTALRQAQLSSQPALLTSDMPFSSMAGPSSSLHRGPPLWPSSSQHRHMLPPNPFSSQPLVSSQAGPAGPAGARRPPQKRRKVAGF